MLTLLTIKNIALIEHLSIEFGEGLNLMTGETGSGKSIIVDSLGALTGQRVSGDLIKSGQTSAAIEGLFVLPDSTKLQALLDESGVEAVRSDETELIVRRELSSTGKNRIFVNGQLVTQGFLKSLGLFLVDIHGQGEQASLFETETHKRMLDRFAENAGQLEKVAAAPKKLVAVRNEIASLENDESEKLQIIDILRFQADEIKAAKLVSGEDSELEEEKHRLNNIGKLTSLADEAFALLYEK